MIRAPQVGVPQTGFYGARLINGGISVGVMIWHGCPVIAGERQDRSPRWCIAVNGRTTDKNGELLDVLERWPFVCGEPISHREFAFRKRRRRWAREHAPEHPAAKPHDPIDLRKLSPVTP
jgi:hypothetical protein